MPETRFIQIHTLHSYAAALLNRDDTGLAKRLPYGGVMRTRVSSQCLKRHWRMADDIHNVHNIEEAEESVRSRDFVAQLIFEPIRKEALPMEVVDEVEKGFLELIFGDEAKKREGRQPLLFGRPEIEYLSDLANSIINEADGDISIVKKKIGELKDKKNKKFKKNMEVMRGQTKLKAGITAALFGRMITSDISANIDAPIHVAHAFTVHEAETEADYFSAVNDLFEPEKILYDPFPKKEGDRAFDSTAVHHINETDLNSGLFYGYVVIDVPGLVSNLTGSKANDWLAADRAMAAKVVHHLVHLIAEVSPGAKLGSTAPYGYAEMLLVEAGDRQPRSLSGAFRKPIPARSEKAVEALKAHLGKLDAAYETGEARRVMQLSESSVTGEPSVSLPELASWVENAISAGEAA